MEDSVLPPTETANVWQLRIANLPHGMPLRFERHAASLVTSLGAHRPSCHSLANGGATKLARSALNPPPPLLSPILLSARVHSVQDGLQKDSRRTRQRATGTTDPPQ
eukprot:scaffold21824_cov28-Tisochrysis_lutea.AAC.5